MANHDKFKARELPSDKPIYRCVKCSPFIAEEQERTMNRLNSEGYEYVDCGATIGGEMIMRYRRRA